jgi:putative ABC transport system permease protein
VAQDAYNQTMKRKISPTAYYRSNDRTYFLSIKLNQENADRTIRFIREKIQKYQPYGEFKYEYFDDLIKESYGSEYRLLNVFSLFSVFTVLIACLGLYGMISFSTEMRRKEIGIRKVLGASAIQIVLLFYRDYMKLFVTAGAAAAIIGTDFMNRWLGTFSNHISIPVSAYIYSVGIVYLLTAATVAFRIIKAADENPVDVIKYE